MLIVRDEILTFEILNSYAAQPRFDNNFLIDKSFYYYGIIIIIIITVNNDFLQNFYKGRLLEICVNIHRLYGNEGELTILKCFVVENAAVFVLVIF